MITGAVVSTTVTVLANGVTFNFNIASSNFFLKIELEVLAKRSFNFGYKVAPRFNLSKAEAEMENGLLNITVPYSSNVTSVKTVKIK